jgi:hypothetical protein
MKEAQTLIGVWKLVEARALGEDGNELPSPLGPQPMGIAIFDAGRSMAMACNGSATLPPATKRAFAAYCGAYSFDGTKLVTKVDGASGPDLLEDQVRQIRFDTPTRMTVIPVSRLFDRGAGLELVWERVG